MSKNASQPKLIACNGHKELSSKIADCLGIKLAKVIVNKIPNGEIVVTIGESLRDQDVYICQTGYGSINDLLMELLITISGCKKASAKRITAGTRLRW